jgi:hypothetical protein
LCGVDFYNATWQPLPGPAGNADHEDPAIVAAEYSHEPGNPMIYAALAIALLGAVLSTVSRRRIWCQTSCSCIAIRWEPTASPSPHELACIRALLREVPGGTFHFAA